MVGEVAGESRTLAVVGVVDDGTYGRRYLVGGVDMQLSRPFPTCSGGTLDLVSRSDDGGARLASCSLLRVSFLKMDLARVTCGSRGCVLYVWLAVVQVFARFFLINRAVRVF